MPRKPRTDTDPAPAGRPLTKHAARVTEPAADDDGVDRHPPQRVWRAAGSYGPLEAPDVPVSPFGKPVVKQAASHTVSLAAVRVESGVPVPDVTPGFRSRYGALIARMGDGDMVRLPRRQAASLVAQMKKDGVRYTRRRLSPDVDGVWRLPPADGDQGGKRSQDGRR